MEGQVLKVVVPVPALRGALFCGFQVRCVNMLCDVGEMLCSSGPGIKVPVAWLQAAVFAHAWMKCAWDKYALELHGVGTRARGGGGEDRRAGSRTG